ncbi:hypothetical protein [Actinokineospora pegani]|uniref:hypothetical protein n=1 Tax=Actinokineospora pegani TaxID=2654637 RepID=UPI0012EADB68|nr:hypothetical protein [Actinokineospora pegani]
MVTSDEIRQRVQENDNKRSARRAAAAQQAGQLVQRRTTLVEQLRECDQTLASVLDDAQDVITVDELAEFIDVKAADLSQWRGDRKPTRRRRKSAVPPASSPAAEAEGPPADRVP